MKITDFKHCSCCNTVKHRDDYHRNIRSTDGKAHWCKPCMREAKARYKRQCAQMRTALWGRA